MGAAMRQLQPLSTPTVLIINHKFNLAYDATRCFGYEIA